MMCSLDSTTADTHRLCVRKEFSFYLLIYFTLYLRLCRVFLQLQQVGLRSRCGVWLLIVVASLTVEQGLYGARALVPAAPGLWSLRSRGTRAELLHGMWEPPMGQTPVSCIGRRTLSH